MQEWKFEIEIQTETEYGHMLAMLWTLPMEVVLAVAMGDLAKVVVWLDSGGYVDMTWDDPSGRVGGITMLMRACLNGDSSLVVVLLKHRASLDLQDSNGMTALMQASGRGHPHIVQELLEAGAQVGLRCFNGMTALLMARTEGNSECASKIEEHMKGAANAVVLRATAAPFAPRGLATEIADTATAGSSTGVATGMPSLPSAVNPHLLTGPPPPSSQTAGLIGQTIKLRMLTGRFNAGRWRFNAGRWHGEVGVVRNCDEQRGTYDVDVHSQGFIKCGTIYVFDEQHPTPSTQGSYAVYIHHTTGTRVNGVYGSNYRVSGLKRANLELQEESVKDVATMAISTAVASSGSPEYIIGDSGQCRREDWRKYGGSGGRMMDVEGFPRSLAMDREQARARAMTCRLFLVGKCQRADCKFFHPEGEPAGGLASTAAASTAAAAAASSSPVANSGAAVAAPAFGGGGPAGTDAIAGTNAAADEAVVWPQPPRSGWDATTAAEWRSWRAGSKQGSASKQSSSEVADEGASAHKIPMEVIAAIETGRRASREAVTKVVEWLDGGGHVDATWDSEDGLLCGITMLMYATVHGRTIKVQAQVVRVLLDRRASVDLQDSNGDSALMWAAAIGQSMVVQRLLEAGAEPGLRNAKGYTAKQLAELKAAEPHSLRGSYTACVHEFEEMKYLLADEEQELPSIGCYKSGFWAQKRGRRKALKAAKEEKARREKPGADDEAAAEAALAQLEAEMEAEMEAEAAAEAAAALAQTAEDAAEAARAAAAAEMARMKAEMEAEMEALAINLQREAELEVGGRDGRDGRGGRGGLGGRDVVSLADANFSTDRPEAPESSMGGETTCIVCFVNPKSHLAVPCGHICVCGDCSARMNGCPYCRATVREWVLIRMV